MNTPKAPESCRSAPVPGKIWDENTPLIPDDHILNVPFSVDENSHLATDFRRNLYQGTGNLRGHDSLGMDFTSAQTLDSV